MQLTLDQSFDVAIHAHNSGNLRQAAQYYRQILEEVPDHPLALHLLGLVALQEGDLNLAFNLIQKAISLEPNLSLAQFNLGNVLTQKGQFDEAISAFRKAIEQNPNHAEARSNLGNALMEQGQTDRAIVAYQQAIAIKPAYAEAHFNLGNALSEKGEFQEAIAAYRQAVQIKPDYAAAFNNLGNALQDNGQIDEAIAAFRRATEVRPNYAQAFCNLGNALLENRKVDEAIDAQQRAIALDPNLAEAHGHLGNALEEKSQLDEAAAAYRRAIALSPDYSEAHNNLGNLLKSTGELDQAIAEYRLAIFHDPDYVEAHSNLIFALLYHPSFSAKAIAQENDLWNLRHAQPLREFMQPHTNDRSADRKLRIGYVSADLREHVVGRNIHPLLQHHDREQFEITCYSHVARPDEMTALLKQNADAWHDIAHLSDEDLAHQIREDQIDILVDLAGHTADNRLLAFAHKPAPVQVTYLGSCGSTGMTAMDYRLTDPQIDPLDTDLSSYSEKTFRLPRSYWCYQPSMQPTPDPSRTPALQNGFITFGSLNNFAKMSAISQDLWIRILQSVPDSRLLLHAPQGQHRTKLINRFERQGVSGDRIRFVYSSGWTQYMETYSQIDIALDPFPYGGNITACDALWMGVPVVTLTGRTPVGRGGTSILTNVGLTELIARTPDQYMSIAKQLTHDISSLGRRRLALREAMQGSPLMDATRFARDIESAYRQMWKACLAG